MSLPSFGESEDNEALERLVGECLTAGGVWSGWREADGISYVRPVEATPGSLRLLGRIWLIDTQAQEPFWLDLTEEGDGRVRWALHFGLMAFGQTPRDLRNVMALMTAPEEGTWRHFLTGTAVLDGERLGTVEADAAAG
jgi:hypothetical protein